MIYELKTRSEALELLAFGEQMHQESRYASSVYQHASIWNLLDLCFRYPNKYFLRYSRNQENKINGFFIGQETIEYFTGKKIASDLGMYVAKENRGSPVFYRMLKAFEDWAKQQDCYKIILYHSTGINTDKAKELFPKMGYTHFGHIFDKEI